MDLPKASQSEDEQKWGKSLEKMPVFTRSHIESHRQRSGKRKLSTGEDSQPVMKSLRRGTKFQEERYLSADDIYAFVDSKAGIFSVKGKCRASMSKKEIHQFKLNLDLTTGDVKDAACTYKAGKGQYCNHIMALLIELADYSLHQLQEIPHELSCTSRSRKWGIPGDKDFLNLKESVLSTTVQKHLSSKGMHSTLYDPRSKDKRTVNKQRLEHMKQELRKMNPQIGFAHVVPSLDDMDTVQTKYGPSSLVHLFRLN